MRIKGARFDFPNDKMSVAFSSVRRRSKAEVTQQTIQKVNLTSFKYDPHCRRGYVKVAREDLRKWQLVAIMFQLVGGANQTKP